MNSPQNQQTPFPDPLKEFETRMRAILVETDFHPDDIMEDFFPLLRHCLHFETLDSIKYNIEDLKALYELCAKPGLMNMWLAGFAINSVQRRSPKEFESTAYQYPEKYLPVIEAATNMADKWNAIVIPIKEQVQNELRAEIEVYQKKMQFEQQMLANTKMRPLGGESANIKNRIRPIPKNVKMEIEKPN